MKTYLFAVSLFRDKNIVREIEVSEGISLYKLAEAIIKSYNFMFDHCFGFFSNIDERGYRKSERVYELFVDVEDVEHSPGAKSVKKTKVAEVWQNPGDKMLFLFDYGDHWLFIVELKSTGETEKGKKYPRIVSRTGKAPMQYGPVE